MINKIINYYKDQGIEKRMPAFIEKIGYEKFSKDILGK
jgi:dissimilatory sulfite reductase (desulfoviridin) alpha/beta subunit